MKGGVVGEFKVAATWKHSLSHFQHIWKTYFSPEVIYIYTHTHMEVK